LWKAEESDRTPGAWQNKKKDINDVGGMLQLWILAAECIGGPYWHKRGWEAGRSHVEEVGTWTSKRNFEMMVFRKEIKYSFKEK